MKIDPNVQRTMFLKFNASRIVLTGTSSAKVPRVFSNNAQSVGPLERGCQSTTINLETRNSRDERVKSARKRNGPGSKEVHAPRSEQKFETRTAVGRRDREKRSTRRDRRSPVHEKTSRKHRRIGQSERAQIESAAPSRFGS